ncbi:MAG TPA: GNAT family N-acetyltransferase [Gemmatimonadaceae bacterium]|nr:GNAT family N-acetyltransferase [Gemmatimonadaceae bacterium]
MAVARTWRPQLPPDGPYRIVDSDIPLLNAVFSDAFTDRYRKDGMAGVRVPYLNPAVWRFAIADARDGAMLWRDDRGNIAAFNVTHLSGAEGWMGPLAVHPDFQAHGLGKTIVTTGIEWLKRQQARVIGLETMPRTMDNIGFYSSLGLLPGYLTLTVTVDAAYAPQSVQGRALRLGALPAAEMDSVVTQCRELSSSMLTGYDFSREMQLTEELALGDTLLVMRNDTVAGFAVAHSVPLVEGRVREELRVLKLVAKNEEDFDFMITVLADHARRSGTRRVAVRVQGQYSEAYRRLISRGARVRWTDLRMSAEGFSERRPDTGIVFSNWEI